MNVLGLLGAIAFHAFIVASTMVRRAPLTWPRALLLTLGGIGIGLWVGSIVEDRMRARLRR